MHPNLNNKMKNLVVVGDRLLIKPRTAEGRTRGGLLLPPGYNEKEEVQYGYVIKVGPGYPLPYAVDDDEPWKVSDEPVKYIPLQAKEGDLAVYLQKNAVEISFEGEKYFIVPQNAVLLLERSGE